MVANGLSDHLAGNFFFFFLALTSNKRIDRSTMSIHFEVVNIAINVVVVVVIHIACLHRVASNILWFLRRLFAGRGRAFLYDNDLSVRLGWPRGHDRVRIRVQSMEERRNSAISCFSIIIVWVVQFSPWAAAWLLKSEGKFLLGINGKSEERNERIWKSGTA